MESMILDKEEALGRLEGDLELWNEIRVIWLEDVDGLFEEVTAKLGERSPDGLRRAAHALKGASANVGAARLASVARELEMSALQGAWPDLEALVGRLGKEVEAARDALNRG